jgi:hypothetical protein
MRAPGESEAEQVEMLPLMIVTQEFSARPSSLPDVRDFVRRQLTTTPMSDDEIRTLCDRVADVLLDAAGMSDVLHVSLRIFPAGAEVDVVFGHSHGLVPPERAEGAGVRSSRGPRAETRRSPVPAGGGAPERGARERGAAVVEAADPGPERATVSFARWLSAGLRREGLTTEAAARRLNVSTKTVSRWVGGTTEPRLRDLYRIREVFGEPPL